MKEKIYILQPSLDQAIAIARLLRQAGYQGQLVALFFPRERIRRVVLATYTSHSVIESYDSLPDDGPIVPTGALSTRSLLERQNVYLGDICMNRQALLCFDKIRFIRFCQDHGVPVPKTWEAPDDIPSSEFPVFYKQRNERGGGIRGIAFSPSDIPSNATDDLIFQEYVKSNGTYGVGFLASEGHILTAHVHYEVESLPKEGGSAVILEHVIRPAGRLLSLVEQLLVTLRYSGWGLAELKYDPERNQYVFMEINAKFWASVEVAFRNEPRFFHHLFGLTISSQHISRAVFLHRALARGPFFLLSHLREFRRSRVIRYPGLATAFAYGLCPTTCRYAFLWRFRRPLIART
jgi:hypothetical protein